jgi:hypothetical protein
MSTIISSSSGSSSSSTNIDSPLDLDISDIAVSLTRIKVARLTLGHSTRMPKVTFDLGADMKELEKSSGRLRLRYTLHVDANPAVERAELEGELTIRNPRIGPKTDLQALGEQKISDIAMQIYAKNYEMLYLTFQSLGLVAPSPLLIQDVHMVPGAMSVNS